MNLLFSHLWNTFFTESLIPIINITTSIHIAIMYLITPGMIKFIYDIGMFAGEHEAFLTYRMWLYAAKQEPPIGNV